jgi:ketosteroid isomerase-like protein
MSQENVDAIRRSNHAFNEGDLEGALQLFDSDAVYYEQPGNPLDTGEVLRGLDQIRESVSSYIAQFPDFRSEIDELLEAGDKVVCVQRWTGTGRGSGIPTELAEVVVHTFEKGKVTEARVYPDRASALEAAGLEE